MFLEMIVLRKKYRRRSWRATLMFALGGFAIGSLMTSQAASQDVELSTGWRLQFAKDVPRIGAEISSANFDTASWYSATVPGTIITSLVNDHVYPEPLYGENIRAIHESLAYESYWYRTTVVVPRSYEGQHVWLNFEGINYSAEVWVNGAEAGTIRGAFVRGIFDITAHVTPGSEAVIAVHVSPQPHPGAPHVRTLREGFGLNSGLSSLDGPTFLSTIGWDWVPTIPDRDTGIWQKVYLSATGPVVVRNPYVSTNLPLPRTDSADLTVQATVENVADEAEQGVLQGEIGNIRFARTVNLAPHASELVTFDAKDTPVLHIESPRLWWPNGYGAQNLYSLHLSFNIGRQLSDTDEVTFGIRKITYTVPGSNTLTISVNGVPVFIRGGNWGLDEALKREPHSRLDAQIHLHQLAHLNLIRNWVGQSTSEDFYELCDKYGILVWDEFFQPSPQNAANPADVPTYLANVRDKVLRFRNHPAILLWCGRNEGDPPPELDEPLRRILAGLDPARLYQSSSARGLGVRSGGPYFWREPRDFYRVTDDFFKTESGSVSVPTLESIHAMMPRKDWDSINIDWVEHDFARPGAQNYPTDIPERYGPFRNLADFVRKAQMANYEAYRAMYEGRNALLFSPTTAVITWMSNPAQPSFGWQIYDYYLEPFASYFAVMHASEMVHIQFNQADDQLQVINNLPTPLNGATAHVAVYNLDGSLAAQYDVQVTAPPESATNFGEVQFPAALTKVHFIDLTLKDAQGNAISNNFYWRALPEHPDDYKNLENMPKVTLDIHAKQEDSGDKRVITVTLHNPTQHIVLMAHVQLRRTSGERVLPVFYSDDYVSLVPKETKTIVIHAATSDFHGQDAVIAVDGWNTTTTAEKTGSLSIEANREADPNLQPATGFGFEPPGLP